MDNMENDNKPKGLFAEFPPVSTAEWEAKIEQDLKGADYEKRLVWKTAEGLKVKPYYRSEDLTHIKEMLSSLPGQFPFLRGTSDVTNQWKISQDIETSNIEKANRQAVDSLKRGADSLLLNVSAVASAQDAANLLKGIDTQNATLLFNSAPSYPSLLEYLTEVLKADGSKLTAVLDFDPISYTLLNGHYYASKEQDLEQGTQLLIKAKESLPLFKVISVNGQYFHNSGSTLVQELAFALAAGNEYLAYYTSRGISVDDVASRMTFVFATGSNYFMEIAKLRAARILWAQIVNQYNPANIKSAAMHIHCITANWNKTIYDPYVNILRTTTEAMSAALGNADIITVLPFDMNYQEPDEFSMRMARNQQIILKEESNLDKVIDPAAGSYYIENLTSSLAEAAWNLFLEVEEKGGMFKAIELGFIQDEVLASAKQRKDDIANRKIIALGTNQHPNLNERMLDKIQMEQESEDTEDEPVQTRRFKTLEVFRGTDEFEDLRLATEIWENEGNKCPAVFMFTIGNLAMRKARAGFSSAFFGSAGYEIINNAGFNTSEEGIKAAIDSKAEIVVLCSSDEEYAEMAADITRSLKSSKPEVLVVVAGNPKEIMDSLKQAGVDEFISVKSNVLNTLYNFQRKLEIMH